MELMIHIDQNSKYRKREKGIKETRKECEKHGTKANKYIRTNEKQTNAGIKCIPNRRKTE
jgi:hypothetical protein